MLLSKLAFNKVFESFCISVYTVTANSFLGGKTDIANSSEILTGMNIRDVHLYGRDVNRLYRIVERDARVSVGGRVYNYSRYAFSVRSVYHINELALVIGLHYLNADAKLLCFCLYQLFQITVGVGAVMLRLSYAEQIQVRTVKDVILLFHL